MQNQCSEQIVTASDEKWLDDAFFNAQMAKLPSDAPRAGLAYRVSTKDQVDHDDIPMQKIECRKFCAQHGWRVVFEKAEKGVSGSKVSAADRDVIQEMRSLALENSFDILLVFMFDRLGRIESETPFVLEWFVSHGIEMWSTREGEQKIENHNDKLMNYLRFWQAAGESDKLSTRIQTRVRQIVSSGHYSGGTVPYGYRAIYKGRVNKKDMPVKDLEIEPSEASIVREIFEKIAQDGYSGYALADMLNARGVKTHRNSSFQCNNILRIVKHRGYTGRITTKHSQSDYIAELEIVDEALFERANEIVSQRCAENAEVRRVAHTCENTTLLAGIVYCAHCGARMSGFMHNDRYKLADGTTREKLQAKYNCYQKSQKLRDCDGQQLYRAEIVDSIVLELVHGFFERIRQEPRDRTIEQRIRAQAQERRGQKQMLEKKMKDAKHALERYEDEVLKAIEGSSSFSTEMLARLIAKSEAELKTAKIDYAKFTSDSETEREALRQIDVYYDEFIGWAEEFDLASLARKRMILSQLLRRVEVGRGYSITVEMNMSYRQFFKEEDITVGADAEESAEVA